MNESRVLSAEGQIPSKLSLAFGYEAEYSHGRVVRESEEDSHIQEVLRLLVQKAREQGKSDLKFKNLNGPFRSFWGATIQREGIAKKSLSLRNLTGGEQAMAEKIAGFGYSVFVSPYPFHLTIRL